jgi:hypothetical protein
MIVGFLDLQLASFLRGVSAVAACPVGFHPCALHLRARHIADGPPEKAARTESVLNFHLRRGNFKRLPP